MFLLNGEWKHSIDLADRGLHYGDGLFETVEVLNGLPIFLDQHLRRLENGCRKLLIPPPDTEMLRQESLSVAATVQRGVLKIIVTRGSGGRGYRPPDPILPTRIVGIYPYPDYPVHFQTVGVALRFCRQRLAIVEALAGIKHLNRLEQVLARAEWSDEAIQEGLMLDNRGAVIEGTMSNLFWVAGGILCTPQLSRCGVLGVIRALVIEIARNHGIAVSETSIDAETLAEADEIFITNSVIGIWPVNRLEQKKIGIGSVTRFLQAALADLRSEKKN